MSQTDFSTTTELPGCGAHPEQLSVMYTRYHFAAGYCEGKEVLEAACGGGQGLGYLAGTAKRVVGGDIDDKALRFAGEHYADDRAIQILNFDAQEMPFQEGSFDVVMLFEAIYYLPDARKFVQEARRVLRPGGNLLITTVNKEWFGFNPSPFTVRYYSAPELVALLESEGFSVRLFRSFQDRPAGLARRIVSWIRKLAVGLHLIPRTMKGKQLLKRLFYGKLTPLPYEVTDGMAPLADLEEVSCEAPMGAFKFLYAAATRQQ